MTPGELVDNARDISAFLARARAVILRTDADLRAMRRARIKSSRHARAQAKYYAWALRHDLRLVADYHLTIDKARVDIWVTHYIARCALLFVDAPLVQVPRSLRRHYGRTVGGPRPGPKGWGMPTPGFEYWPICEATEPAT